MLVGHFFTRDLWGNLRDHTLKRLCLDRQLKRSYIEVVVLRLCLRLGRWNAHYIFMVALAFLFPVSVLHILDQLVSLSSHVHSSLLNLNC